MDDKGPLIPSAKEVERKGQGSRTFFSKLVQFLRIRQGVGEARQVAKPPDPPNRRSDQDVALDTSMRTSLSGRNSAQLKSPRKIIYRPGALRAPDGREEAQEKGTPPKKREPNRYPYTD